MSEAREALKDAMQEASELVWAASWMINLE
jgi:hypothetical protein